MLGDKYSQQLADSGIIECSSLQEPEKIRGQIEVTVQLSMGYERMRLYFTSRRIIASHSAKVGAGSVVPTFMLGWIGTGLGSLFGKKKGSKLKSKNPEISPDRILASHKGNFSISNDEIVSVDLTTDPHKNSITILSSGDKYTFTTRTRFETLRGLFHDSLGEKVHVHESKDG